MKAIDGIEINSENYFDIAEACHAWLSTNHEGQRSDTYELLCKSAFEPGAMWSESRVENEYFPLITKDNVADLLEASNNFECE